MGASLKEIAQTALQNNASRDAMLIIVGRISYAFERGEITLEEARELENMLGGREQWKEALEMALTGSVDEDWMALNTLH